MPRNRHASPQTLRLFEALLADPTAWRYGYDLSRETHLASGTLYPILMRLAAAGLLDTDWENSPEPGRPPRHTYRLTDSGAALARERVAAAEAAANAPAKAATTRAATTRAATTRAPGAVNGRLAARVIGQHP